VQREHSALLYHSSSPAAALRGLKTLLGEHVSMQLLAVVCNMTLQQCPSPLCTVLLLLQVPFKSMINNSCQGGSLVAAILTGDAALLGAALDSDAIIEPVRAPLIPGMPAVKEAAKQAGGRTAKLVAACCCCNAAARHCTIATSFGHA
jgi:hypothetical protein